jgi:hypothetical protein
MFEKLMKISEMFFQNNGINTDGMVIHFDLSEDDHIMLDKELYVKKNGTIKGFVKNEEIDLILNGIKFLIKKNN